ncbi:MAG: hypothetical protein GX797_03110 [Chloroflexi bacterium]|jgi:hypothetical protein|nr:hypothetical protein [Chloroflexota bacterium]
MKARLFLFLSCFLLVALALSACRPAEPTPVFLPTTEHLDLMKTAQIKVTQASRLTQAAQPSATLIPTATIPLMPDVIPTIERSPTPEPTATANVACNRASPGEPFDITIPDDTKMFAGEEFTKTWRLVNTGSCKWTRLYKLVFYSQNPMGAFQQQFLSGEVLPGQAIDLSVDFTAPTQPGTYQSNWMLQDQDGNLFGIGFNADGPFYVRVQVTNDPTPTPEPTP